MLIYIYRINCHLFSFSRVPPHLSILRLNKSFSSVLNWNLKTVQYRPCFLSGPRGNTRARRVLCASFKSPDIWLISLIRQVVNCLSFANDQEAHRTRIFIQQHRRRHYRNVDFKEGKNICESTIIIWWKFNAGQNR